MCVLFCIHIQETANLYQIVGSAPDNMSKKATNVYQMHERKFSFHMPFVYPLAEDIESCCSNVIAVRAQEHVSCTQEFNDNFNFINLTQMLENNIESNLGRNGLLP